MTAVYPKGVSSELSGLGKTSKFIVFYCDTVWLDNALMYTTLLFFNPYLTSEPLGGVKNLQVTDPTTSTLKVQWEPAEGDVRQYKVNYIPTAGGREETVIWKTYL